MDNLGFVPETAEPTRAPASGGDDLGFVAEEPKAQIAPVGAAPVKDDIGFEPSGEEYGTPGQMAIGLAEQTAMGALGPAEAIVPYAETKLGLTTTEAIKGREEQLGIAAPIAQMAGFALGPGKAVSALGKGAGAAVKAIGAGKALATGIGFGTELAALSGGHEITKKILNEPDASASNAAINMGLNFVLGTGAGAGFQKFAVPFFEKNVAPKLTPILDRIKTSWKAGEPPASDGQVISPTMRRILINQFGADPKAIDAYVAQRDAILAAPERQEVYDHALEQIESIRENLAFRKGNVKESQAKIDQFFKDQVTELKQKGYEAKQAENVARTALDQAQMRVEQALQDSAVEAAPNAFSAIQKLKETYFKASDASRDILDAIPGTFSLRPFYDAVQPMADELYQKGRPELAQNLLNFIEDYRGRFGDEISYPQVKNLIQGLRSRSSLPKGNVPVTEMFTGTMPYYSELQHVVDQGLKDAVPAYRKAMEPTAELGKLFGNKVLRKYGTPESAVKAVLQLGKPANYITEMPVLRSLENATGIRFAHAFENFANPEISDKMIKALPEYGAHKESIAFLQSLKDPATRDAIEKMLEIPGAPGVQELKFDTEKLAAAEARMETIKGITPASLEGKLKSVAGGRNAYAAQQLAKIKGMEVPGFGKLSIPDILKLIHYREAFEKGATTGSRNVNFWSKTLGGFLKLGLGPIGGFVGYHELGPMAGILGGSAGAVLGSIIDKEGPAMAKQYLDSVLNRHPELASTAGMSEKEAKAALLHFLNSPDAPTDPMAFKATGDYIKNVGRGADLLKKASKAIFQGGKVLPSHLIPSKEHSDKLDEKAKDFEKSGQLENVGNRLGTYMPDHGRSLAQIAGTAVTAINGHRPNPQAGAFFDGDIEPTHEQKRAYANALKIAQQPLTILEKVQNGTLIPEDIQIVQKTNPFAYDEMRKAVTEAMLEHKAENGKVPYHVRQALSLFTGQNLDASLLPQNIMAAQKVFMMQKAAAMPPAQTRMKGLEKAPKEHQTADQATQQRRIEGQ